MLVSWYGIGKKCVRRYPLCRSDAWWSYSTMATSSYLASPWMARKFDVRWELRVREMRIKFRLQWHKRWHTFRQSLKPTSATDFSSIDEYSLLSLFSFQSRIHLLLHPRPSISCGPYRPPYLKVSMCSLVNSCSVAFLLATYLQGLRIFPYNTFAHIIFLRILEALL